MGKRQPQALYARKLGRTKDESFETYREFVETRPAETVANLAICLIHQTNYLLDQYLRHLESDFFENVGIRERMTTARIKHRKENQ